MQKDKKLLTDYANEYIIKIKNIQTNKSKEEERMLLNLKTEMERNGYSINVLANALGIHKNSMTNKILGKTPLSFEEAQSLRDKLFPYADLQYLFRNYPNIEKGKGA